MSYSGDAQGKIKIIKNKAMEELEPSEFYLAQNYPNPFNKKTAIKYSVAYKTRVQITVYDLSGSIIENLVDAVKKPGTYEVQFSAGAHGHTTNEREIYFYRLEAGNYKCEKKMIFQK